ncbi:MAG: hypothetical protein Kilf2KO_39130 [Rhodospirillales bacterium]
MLFAVFFEDNPAKASERARLMTDHLAFLEARSDSVLAAGPLKEAGAGAGGLWLVEAPGVEAVETLVQEDPFLPTGLRKSVRILEWTRVFTRAQTSL